MTTAWPSARLEEWILGAAAVAVAAPALAAGAALFRMPDRFLRRLATAAIGVALLASLTVTVLWNLTDGATITRGSHLGGGAFLHVDGLPAVLLPYASLVALAIVLARPRRSLDRWSVARKLLGCSATLATFLTAHPAVLVVMWGATALPTWHSVRSAPGGRGAARVFAIAMVAALACVAVGTALLVTDPPWERYHGTVGAIGGWLVAVAVLLRKGVVPFHSWVPLLFCRAPMSTALAATMPQVASYAAVRLLVGHAAGVGPELVFLSNAALVTTAYGAALAIVQRDARGLVGCLAMSQSAMVLAGIAATVPMELAGALAVWVSSGLALTGIGLVVWALESRAGHISIDTLQGRFLDAPTLAAFFLLFGLASLGFPGTLSFVADDLIITGALEHRTFAGVLVILATVFAGIAVIRGWFRIFGGPATTDAPRHEILARERLAFAALLAILFGLGLWPGPFVRSLDAVAHSVLALPGTAPAHSPVGAQP